MTHSAGVALPPDSWQWLFGFLQPAVHLHLEASCSSLLMLSLCYLLAGSCSVSWNPLAICLLSCWCWLPCSPLRQALLSALLILHFQANPTRSRCARSLRSPLALSFSLQSLFTQSLSFNSHSLSCFLFAVPIWAVSCFSVPRYHRCFYCAVLLTVNPPVFIYTPLTYRRPGCRQLTVNQGVCSTFPEWFCTCTNCTYSIYF